MPYESVESIVRCIVDRRGDVDFPVENYDVDSLGVSLPNLRRPSGVEGEWDVARYQALPPALRAASVFFTFRAEVANGGLDQFVYNQMHILPATIEAFVHIKAFGAVNSLLTLGEALVATDEAYLSADAVQGFLAFRRATEHSGWDGDDDEVHEVREAILQHASDHPEQFVVSVVERNEWRNDRQRLRVSVLRRPDGMHEVQVDIGIDKALPEAETSEEETTHAAMASCRWFELSRPPALFALAEARKRAKREAEARRVAPTSCSFVVSSCSKNNEGGFRVWPNDKLSLDRLPLSTPLRVTFTRGEEKFSTKGHFVEDTGLSDGRGYGQVISDEAPPDTDQWPPLQPQWNATCSVLVPGNG